MIDDCYIMNYELWVRITMVIMSYEICKINIEKWKPYHSFYTCNSFLTRRVVIILGSRTSMINMINDHQKIINSNRIFDVLTSISLYNF